MALLLAACADWARSLTPTPGFVHGRSSSSAAEATGSLLAVAVDAVVLIDTEFGPLVDLDVVADAGRELEIEVVDAAVRRVRVDAGFTAVVAGSRVDELIVFGAAFTAAVEEAFAGALVLVVDALPAEATRFFACGSGSLTWSTRSSVAARSSSVDVDAAAVRLVVRVATLVDGGAATRAGIVVGGVWCCCCFGRKQHLIQGHPEVIRAVCGGWARLRMALTWPMTFVKFRPLSDSVMNSCPLELL